MRGGTQVRREVRILFDSGECGWSAEIPIFADECIDSGIFAKFLDAGSEHDQLAVICERHAGAVNRLVAQPGALELALFEIDDSFPNAAVEHFKVDFKTEIGGAMETLNIVADEEAAYSETALCIAPDDRVHIHDGNVIQETIGGIVQDLPHRVVGASHDALHAVDGAQVVTAVDAFASPGSDKDVLVVVGHADDFVGHDLSDRKHEIEAALRDQAIDLRRPRVVEFAFRLLTDKFRRDFAKRFDIDAPVMHAEERVRHLAEHTRNA